MPVKTYQRICTVCEVPFVAGGWNTKYCSKACRDSTKGHLEIGQTVNRWTVMEFLGLSKHYNRHIRVQCECGTIAEHSEGMIKSGLSKSCGCLQKEIRRAHSNRERHGMKPQGRTTPEYQAYTGAKGRCTNPNIKSYPDYGGRGITFEFETFEEWFEELGPKPGPEYSVNRIDNDQGYRKGNVEWATRDVQAKNRRPNKLKSARRN